MELTLTQQIWTDWEQNWLHATSNSITGNQQEVPFAYHVHFNCDTKRTGPVKKDRQGGKFSEHKDTSKFLTSTYYWIFGSLCLYGWCLNTKLFGERSDTTRGEMLNETVFRLSQIHPSRWWWEGLVNVSCLLFKLITFKQSSLRLLFALWQVLYK